jgi:DNA end-binding protein Ku
VPDEESVAESAAGRSFWSGAITFGLVNVPVALYPANRGRSVSLKMVADGGHPLQRHYVCSKDGAQLDWDEIVRGYEVKPGKFVSVTDDELEAIAPRKSREIDLQLFVDLEEIDPVFFVRAYFLAPAGGTTKAYRLLAEVMERTGRAGIATFVMRAKEYVVAIISEKGILRAETLRFYDEVRTPADVGLPKKSKVTAAAVSKFTKEITSHSGKVNFREFFDEYAVELEKLAKKKAQRNEDVVKAPAEAAASESDEPGEVIDILEVLKRSLGGAAGKKPAKRAPPRKRTATTKKRASKKK